MNKFFYIKERYNPQLGTYYVARGQMTKGEAKACEKPVYGRNKMHGFKTEQAYNERLAELRESGASVQ